MSVEQLKDKSEMDYSIEELAEELTNGPDWLTDKRRNSQKAFNDTPVPPPGIAPLAIYRPLPVSV